MRYFRIGFSAAAALIITALGPAYTAETSARFDGISGTIILNIAEETLTIKSQTYPLKSCSDERYFCFESAAADFAIVLPKSCPQSEPYWDWETHDVKTVIIGVLPHTSTVSLRSEGHPHFIFRYDTQKGLVEIDHDTQGTLFGRDGGWFDLSYDERENTGSRLKVVHHCLHAGGKS